LKDQVELPNMFKKYSYDEMKSLLETWMETGNVGDSEEETNPTTSSSDDNTSNVATTPNATTANVKDAFDDLFNN
jgi:hypothetical protein